MDLVRETHHDLVYYRCLQFPEGVSHGFTTKLGGVSTGDLASLNLISSRGDDPALVAENYRRFHQAVGCTASVFARNQQVHGNKVVVVPRFGGCTLEELTQPERTFQEGDALMTNRPGIALWVYNADCVPLLFYDPVRKVIGAAHAGWRGTAGGIAEKTIQAMGAHYGCQPKHILVALGPAIGACCFSCHSDVGDAMIQALGDGATPFIKEGEMEEGERKFWVDLHGINRLWLRRAGVKYITENAPCTSCQGEEFWSHRVLGDKRGSLGGMIALE